MRLPPIYFASRNKYHSISTARVHSILKISDEMGSGQQSSEAVENQASKMGSGLRTCYGTIQYAFQAGKRIPTLPKRNGEVTIALV